MVRPSERKEKWMEWVREKTCACSQCQVRQGTKHDTWMTIIKYTKMRNLEPSSS